jgi:nucleoside-diphosphate-sugar epimerase
MRVLVTGSTSLLGAGVCQRLDSRGDNVVALQRGKSDGRWLQVQGDIRDATKLPDVMRGADAVIHLAARVAVNGPWDEFFSVNVQGTQNVLAAARDAGVRRFVYVSSPSVAHDPERAIGHYARSKAMAERIALKSADQQMAVVAVRPHLVWGPGDTQLVGRVVDRASSGRLVLIDGGTALIDTTYVDNAVDALICALDVAPSVSGEAFVVTNGEPRTVAELLARICHAAGVPEPTRSVPRPLALGAGTVVERAWSASRRDEEPPMTRFLAEQLSTAHWFDQTTTRERLHWRPAVTLAEGFERLAAAFRG